MTKRPIISVKKKIQPTVQTFKMSNVGPRIANAFKSYIARRPHRSFKMTRRRDYVRSLQLPGYFSFTLSVWRIIWKNRRLFGGLIVVYALIYGAFVGLASQDLYNQLGELLQSGDGNGFNTLEKSGVLVLSGLSGSLNPQLGQAQQLYGFILLLMTWLTTIWLLRALTAGQAPRFRDALYNSGSPIIATGIVFIILTLQLIPAALAILAINLAVATNLFSIGIVSLLITVGAILLLLLSIYWATSTVVALVIVTLPGMYPWQAVRAAGDIVIGRRFRIVLRILWLALSNVLLWIVIVLPMVLIDQLIKKALPAISGVPFVPITILLVSSFAVIWTSSYVYLLYRKVVEDDASPA